MSTPPAAAAIPGPTTARGFGGPFWFLNTIEMFERLAFYTLRVMAPIYIMQADDPGGLHLTASQKGVIYAFWAAFQSLLPIFPGGFADRYGYKKTLFFSFVMMTAGYLIIALARQVPAAGATLAELEANANYNYWAFFAGILTLATGTAFFKPSIQGSLAQNLTKQNSSVGWSIFYWVVNVGAFIGHFLPAIFLRGEHTPEAWRNLFLAAAAMSSLNFLMLLTFKDVPSGAPKDKGLFDVLLSTFVNVFEPRLLMWLVIMSGFWMMMYQLWDLQPNFIADWIDSGPVAESLRFLPDWAYNSVTQETARGRQIPQNVILSLNSLFIIGGVVGMGWVTRKMRTLTAMLLGMIVCAAGVLIAGLTMNPWILFAGIACFSMGEMLTGPKKSEYLALIAPPGKKGLYLGYVNIPVGFGVFVGSWIAGEVYDRFGEKATLALKYIVQKDPALFAVWDGDVRSLEKLAGITRPKALEAMQKITDLDSTAATQLLWDTYSPQYHVWIPFFCIGIVSAIALYIFGQMAKKWSDMNA